MRRFPLITTPKVLLLLLYRPYPRLPYQRYYICRVLHGLANVETCQLQLRFSSVDPPSPRHLSKADTAIADQRNQKGSAGCSLSMLALASEAALRNAPSQRLPTLSLRYPSIESSPPSLSAARQPLSSRTIKTSIGTFRVEPQVLIPQPSPSGQQGTPNDNARSLRTRRPIQLHPYLLEGQRYRQTLKDRGVRPVGTDHGSPRRHAAGQEETQELEYSPERASSPNSPGPETQPSPSRGAAASNHVEPNAPQSFARPVCRISREGGIRSHERDAVREPKRRKLSQTVRQRTNASDILATEPMADINDRGASRDSADIWKIPPSPPQSSSPWAQLRAAVPAPQPVHSSPKLPTPATLKETPKLHSRVILSSSDGEASPAPSPRRSIISSASSKASSPSRNSPRSSNDSSSDESGSEGSDSQQMRRMGRRLRGVLPASWLRFDHQARVNRDVHPSARSGAQVIQKDRRGVARNIIHRTRSPCRAQPESGDHTDPVVVSDTSSDSETASAMPATEPDMPATEPGVPATGTRNATPWDASPLRLSRDPLGVSASAPAKKRQLKLDHSWRGMGNVKRSKKRPAGAPRKTAPRKKSSRVKNTGVHYGIHHALSILDSGHLTSEACQEAPQFIRIAMRQARQRPDNGRCNPTGKHVRLRTRGDTEDASEPLRQWRAGTLRPRSTINSIESASRLRWPLSDRTNRQLDRPPSPTSRDAYERMKDAVSEPPFLAALEDESAQPSFTSRPQHPLFRANYSGRRRSRDAVIANAPRQKPIFKPPSHRSAQLEGVGPNINRIGPRSAFGNQLRVVGRQFLEQARQTPSPTNPLPKRFPAHAEATPTTSLSTEGSPQASVDASSGKAAQRSRPPRKRAAQRVDVECREFRQPIEPIFEATLEEISIDTTSAVEHPVLLGLGPFGTVYATNFDVFPLEIGTFFHSGTFIGSGELSRALRTRERDFDVAAGYHTIYHGTTSIRCGPWNDDAFSRMVQCSQEIFYRFDEPQADAAQDSRLKQTALQDASQLLRSLVIYVSTTLHFLDVVDRREFATRMTHFLDALFSNTMAATGQANRSRPVEAESNYQHVRVLAYLLVLNVQVGQVAQHPVVEQSSRSELKSQAQRIAKCLAQSLRLGIVFLRNFLDDNRRYRIREAGVRDESIFAESIVVAMHLLQRSNILEMSFWDVVSDELSKPAAAAVHLSAFEAIWASTFALLPFAEFDAEGVLCVNRRSLMESVKWPFVRVLVKRLFDLYPETAKRRSASLNSYVRAVLMRCHSLVHDWGWTQCDGLLGTVFDFFARSELSQLQHEDSRGSPAFLERLIEGPNFDIRPEDPAFHIFLKCLALGLKGMQSLGEKKLRSVTSRCTPNHGRLYPKEEDMRQADLAALRNHHDMLCTLYWASPPARPTLVRILRGLVQHSYSHREACRINVRAWSILLAFQISTQQDSSTVDSFTQWHKEMLGQTLEQFQLARSEAESHLQAATSDGFGNHTLEELCFSTVQRNQDQLVATMRDCVAGMSGAIKVSGAHTMAKKLLETSGLLALLDLFDAKKPRLNAVVVDTLRVLDQYAILKHQSLVQAEAQQSKEESQDYGDFPDLDELEELQSVTPAERQLDLLVGAAWNLISNVFGAERLPEDNLCMAAVDTWIRIAECQVLVRERAWSDFLDPFGSFSWYQLRNSEQARKFKPYFLASVVERSSKAYIEHQGEISTTLLLSLAERDSRLRFQYRLTGALLEVGRHHAILQNLPFVRDSQTGRVSITPEDLRTRRVAVISCVLANMREDLRSTVVNEPERVIETRREYAAMLKKFMDEMRKNYQELRQIQAATGAYVDFVHQVVQFLQQYGQDICPVDAYFTDSIAFPLPGNDPAYVVGQLGNYACKISEPGVTKQLSMFVLSIAEQAAADGQQNRLVGQLTQTMSLSQENGSVDGRMFNRTMLQGIFPSYLDAAFRSAVGSVLALPILRTLVRTLEDLLFGVDVFDAQSVEANVQTMICILQACARIAHLLTENAALLAEPHVCTAMGYLFSAAGAIVPTAHYVHRRTRQGGHALAVIRYLRRFRQFAQRQLSGQTPAPIFSVEEYVPETSMKSLAAFTASELQLRIRANWIESDNGVFCRRHGLMEQVADEEDMYSAKRAALDAMNRFIRAVRHTDGPDDVYRGLGR